MTRVRIVTEGAGADRLGTEGFTAVAAVLLGMLVLGAGPLFGQAAGTGERAAGDSTKEAPWADLASELEQVLHWADPAATQRAVRAVDGGGSGREAVAQVAGAVLAEWRTRGAAEPGHQADGAPVPRPLLDALAHLVRALGPGDRASPKMPPAAEVERVRLEIGRVAGLVGRYGRIAPPRGASLSKAQELTGDGSISGEVVEAATSSPLESVIVDVYDDAGGWVDWGYTAADGSYSVEPLPPGTYFVRTYQAITHYDELYDDLPCADGCDVTTGTPVAVAGGADTSGIAFALEPAGTISGTITEDGTSVALSDAQVWAYRIADGGDRLAAIGHAGSDGTYSIYGLEAGSYRLWARSDEHVDELYDDIPCPVVCFRSDGAPVAVTDGGETSGVDFALEPGGAISGAVTDEGTGEPLGSSTVIRIYDGDGLSLGGRFNEAEGSYRIGGLPGGTYYVKASRSGYVDELYDDVFCGPTCVATGGTPVSVTVGADATGVDFALAEAGEISGTVTAENTGLPLPNVLVYVYRDSSDHIALDVTAANGSYTVAGLPAGSYFVLTQDSSHLDELYDDLPCEGGTTACDPTAGTPVPVTAGTATGGISFVLADASNLFGVVTHAVTFDSVEGVRVTAYDELGRPVASALSESDGTYELWNLATKSYYLVANLPGAFAPQVHFYRPFGMRAVVGSPVMVSPGGWNGPADFYLAPLGACGFPNRLDVLSNSLQDRLEAAACMTLVADDGLHVAGSGSLVLRSGGKVVLGDGFSVASGGRLQIATSVLPPPEGDVLYREDFDDGFALGWESSNQTADLWRIDSGCSAPPSAGSTLAFSRAAPDCDYDLGTTAAGWVRSPLIDLSGIAAATLAIDHSWEVDSGAGAPSDLLTVQVSADGGTTWADLWTRDGTTSGGFVEEMLDVSAYATSQFRVRFRFDSVDGTANAAAGWYVDQVTVTSD